MIDPDKIYAKLVQAGEDWAKAEETAQLLEELKSSVLSNLKLQTDGSDAAKETWAKAQPEYENHIKGMVQARKEANLKRVRYKAAEVYCDMLRTKAANLRTEMRMT